MVALCGTRPMSDRLSGYVARLETRTASGLAATPLYDHKSTVPRADVASGYVRTTRGGYRAATAGAHRRPTVAFADDAATPADLAMSRTAPLRTDADRLLG